MKPLLGIDLSATFLAEAEKYRVPGRSNPRFQQGRFATLGELGEEFSVVIITAAPFFKDLDGLRQVSEQVFSVLSKGGRFLFDYSNWKVRSKRDDYPQIDWWKDGDAFVLRRNDWSDSAQHLLFEWYWIDLVQQEFLCSRAKIMAVAPRAVVSTVKSVGFDPVTTLAKWGVRPFDEDRDRGFVLVASK